MTLRTAACLAGVIAALAGPAIAQPPQLRNFVSCPVVQDTQTVPCWLSEYQGELYYLGIQTDISAEFHPPYLGHTVLVEGVVSDEPRVCGGLVLKPVVVSPLPEPDAACNTILPAVDKYTVPFAPRPPGPSGGTLAFQAPAPAPERREPPFTAREFSVHYDFDMPVAGRHARVLSRIVDYVDISQARRLTVLGLRGATLLSDGRTLAEREGIGRARADELADLLRRAGVLKPAIEVSSRIEPEPADGVEDWRSRRTVVRVEP